MNIITILRKLLLSIFHFFQVIIRTGFRYKRRKFRHIFLQVYQSPGEQHLCASFHVQLQRREIPVVLEGWKIIYEQFVLN